MPLAAQSIRLTFGKTGLSMNILRQPMQTDFFQATAVGPSGFIYEPDVVSVAEEAELIKQIAMLPLAEFKFQQYLAKRRVIYFGWRYDFENSKFEPTEPIPDFLLELRKRAACFAGLAPNDLPHALVTEYSPGTEIGWHRDRPVFDDVVGVSLASPCSFRFRRKSGTTWERHTIIADPRSIYLMRGVSRWEWEHSIPAVDSLRYSVTFRSLRDPKHHGAR
jgi:alkylated DNA repair dioxygenase AlkB